MQRWLAECKEVRTKNSRNKSGSILYMLLRQHIMKIEEHETIAFSDIPAPFPRIHGVYYILN